MARVVVGFSGGVDSTTSALFLKDQGYEVLGVTLVVSGSWNEQNIEYAKRSAMEIGIEHMVVDCRKEFESVVISPYIEAIASGITASPCPLCNQEFKFAKLSQIADKQNTEFIATGHYARTVEDNGVSYIARWNETFKDQSYMLYRLSPKLVAKLLFPLAMMNTKGEVRNIASNNKLSVATRADSQGLCFASDGVQTFLEHHLTSVARSGDIVDTNGNILGVHRGYQYYTLGQRRGLGLVENKPYFVVAIDRDNNRLVVGDYNLLYRKNTVVSKFILHGKYNQTDSLTQYRLTARPRYSSLGEAIERIEPLSNGNALITFEKETAHLAPGQHLVLYNDNQVVVGGGIIELG